MKQFVCLLCTVCLVVASFAQPSNLLITTGKTTSLIFPYPIRHVDRGTKDVLVQAVQQADNILLVKAASKHFDETNLSVITSDGSVYVFPVRYGEPSLYVYHFAVQRKTAVATYANCILDNPKTVRGISDASWDMVGRVVGIYIKGDVIYYQLDLQNQSPIDYDVSFLRFYTRDRKKAKRTAVQEDEQVPLYVAGNTSLVKANSHNLIVVALDKFTIGDAKFLAIEIGEKNGGRTLLMKVGNRKIMKAIVLPDIK